MAHRRPSCSERREGGVAHAAQSYDSPTVWWLQCEREIDLHGRLSPQLDQESAEHWSRLQADLAQRLLRSSCLRLLLADHHTVGGHAVFCVVAIGPGKGATIDPEGIGVDVLHGWLRQRPRHPKKNPRKRGRLIDRRTR